ncbi:hypothetical protein GCM10010193_34490 [Kitasatospora atroaurantiaca]|uniref:Secreted protein n=1 Tax=Kitasatospora atroaurantiaca TaxID=285545 RepID=A0A561ENV3_9ACTN|nr:hypothetical protein [Kitasatospora atroaurantiaca]TWE17301.1 hypothetical protein FB465_2309 [Kitasatospora atroaurantiaca]
MDVLGVVIALVVLFGVGVLTMVVIGAVKAARAVAAKVEQHEANARRAVETATLKAKKYTKPGSQGQIAAVRLSLRTSLDGTRRVLEDGLTQDGQLAEALQLLTRLDAYAAELDGELRVLEREPDAGRVAAKLPELRERAERITHSAESMRWAAQDRMRRFADDELARLSEECASEAGALRHWDSGPVPSSSPAGPDPVRKGLSTGRQMSAEEVLGLAEPLTRLAQRLRKPSTGPSTGSSSAM